eukprot:2623067-Rhodomonas_salina.1
MRPDCAGFRVACTRFRVDYAGFRVNCDGFRVDLCYLGEALVDTHAVHVHVAEAVDRDRVPLLDPLLEQPQRRLVRCLHVDPLH